MAKAFSIGHGNTEISKFISILKENGIACLVDVRSIPYSSYARQFNKEQLENKLENAKIKYVYLGEKLGGKQKIDFKKYVKEKNFEDGIKELEKEIEKQTTAFMCSENDFMECHRRYIGDALTKRGHEIVYLNGNQIHKEKQPTLEIDLINGYKLYTIGFSKKSLEEFVEFLKMNKITRVIDIRLNNKSQLSGFAKENDLKYLLEKLLNIKYVHILDFAPTKEILEKYRKDKNWDEYVKEFTILMKDRNLGKYKNTFLDNENNCLLCSEDLPNKCHRRLIAEYFRELIPEIEIIYLTKRNFKKNRKIEEMEYMKQIVKIEIVEEIPKN